MVNRSMTKAQMAATPHVMRGDFAVTTDGRMWLWDSRFSQWSAWK